MKEKRKNISQVCIIYVQRGNKKKKKIQVPVCGSQEQTVRFEFRKFSSSIFLRNADGYAMLLPETSSL